LVAKFEIESQNLDTWLQVILKTWLQVIQLNLKTWILGCKSQNLAASDLAQNLK